MRSIDHQLARQAEDRANLRAMLLEYARQQSAVMASCADDPKRTATLKAISGRRIVGVSVSQASFLYGATAASADQRNHEMDCKDA